MASVDAANRVQVFARVRPPNPKEDGSMLCVEANDASRTICVRNQSDAVDRVLKGQTADSAVENLPSHSFTFDGVFPSDATQRDVFTEVGLPVMRDCLKGVNGTILAYGQTGSGKTHSLLHQGKTSDEAGLLPRLVASLFVHVAHDTANVYQIEAAAVQVYNEQVDDLLHPDHQKGTGQNLAVQNGGGMSDLTWIQCQRPDVLLEAFTRARANVVYAETKMNKASSRSHAVFQIKVTKRQRATGPPTAGNGQARRMECTRARLSVVDLAGSERVKKSGVEGQQFKEATAINKSLLAFGNVVSALAAKRSHIPFRDSKLTRILEGSVGGNCKTCLLVCASPASEHVTETLSTCEFASRAMRVEVDAKINSGVVEVTAKTLLCDLTTNMEDLGLSIGSEMQALQKASKEAMERAQMEVKQKQSAIMQAADEAKRLQKVATDAEQTACNLSKEVETLLKSKQQAEGETEKLRMSIDSTEKTLSEWRRTAEAKTAENAKLAGQLADTSKKLSDAQQECDSAVSRAQKAEACATAAKTEANKWQGSAQKLQTELAAAQQERDHAIEHARELDSLLISVREQHEKSQDAAAEHASRLQREQEERRAADLDEIEQKKSVEVELAEAKAATISQELAVAKSQAEALQEMLRNADGKVKHLEMEIESHTKELSVRSTCLDEVRAALQAFTREAENKECLLREQHAEELACAKSARLAQITKLQSDHQAALLQAQEDNASVAAEGRMAMERAEARHRAKHAAMEAKLQEVASQWAAKELDLKAAHRAEIDVQRSELEQALQRGKNNFERKLAEAENAFKADKNEWRKALDAKSEELALANDRAKIEVSTVQAENVKAQRRIAAAFKSARCLLAAREKDLREEHNALSKRFAQRESRQEDMHRIKEMERALDARHRSHQFLEEQLDNVVREQRCRDQADRIFSGPQMRGRNSSAGPRGGTPVLPGKRVGDQRSFSERRRQLINECRSASADRGPVGGATAHSPLKQH